MRNYAVELLTEHLSKASWEAEKLGGALQSLESGNTGMRDWLHPYRFEGLKGVEAARAVYEIQLAKAESYKTALMQLDVAKANESR